MAALALTSAARSQSSVQFQPLQLSRNGWMPNNEHLPVLIYHRAFEPSPSAADRMEQAFARNQWPTQWRNGVYDFHHYHSTAHEVLGFAGGSAHLMLGGEAGHELTVEAGDVIVLPTGTGHCRISATPSFLVIGAYPAGQHWDICRTAPDQAAIARMHSLHFPAIDPVQGPRGELPQAWHPPNA